MTEQRTTHSSHNTAGAPSSIDSDDASAGFTEAQQRIVRQYAHSREEAFLWRRLAEDTQHELAAFYGSLGYRIFKVSQQVREQRRLWILVALGALVTLIFAPIVVPLLLFRQGREALLRVAMMFGPLRDLRASIRQRSSVAENAARGTARKKQPITLGPRPMGAEAFAALGEEEKISVHFEELSANALLKLARLGFDPVDASSRSDVQTRTLDHSEVMLKRSLLNAKYPKDGKS